MYYLGKNKPIPQIWWKVFHFTLYPNPWVTDKSSVQTIKKFWWTFTFTSFMSQLTKIQADLSEWTEDHLALHSYTTALSSDFLVSLCWNPSKKIFLLLLSCIPFDKKSVACFDFHVSFWSTKKGRFVWAGFVKYFINCMTQKILNGYLFQRNFLFGVGNTSENYCLFVNSYVLVFGKYAAISCPLRSLIYSILVIYHEGKFWCAKSSAILTFLWYYTRILLFNWWPWHSFLNLILLLCNSSLCLKQFKVPLEILL